MKLIAILIIALTSTTVFANWADKKPFCKFPGVFPVSRKPDEKFFDISATGVNLGVWYSVAFKEFGHGKRCSCMTTVYGLEFSGEKVGTAFACATDTAYTNVWLTANNSQKTSYDGWMRFSPTGKFWIPFNHWVLDSDVNGQWHVISEPCGEMLFIMSRTKSIDSVTY